MAINTILFDLDNTLTDRATSIRAFSEQFFRDFRPKLHELITLTEIHRVIEVGDGGGYRPKEAMFREIQSDLPWAKAPTLEAIASYWYTVSAQCMQLRDDVVATLEALQERGYALGIITNGKTDVQNATIDAVKIRSYFATIVISEASGVRKPDPEIFNLALSRLNQPANVAMYIGDNPDADIQGARNAGLVSVWITNGKTFPSHLHAPDYQINQIGEVLGILAIL
jgi:putative hydrolase of the HAD superfamily